MYMFTHPMDSSVFSAELHRSALTHLVVSRTLVSVELFDPENDNVRLNNTSDQDIALLQTSIADST